MVSLENVRYDEKARYTKTHEYVKKEGDIFVIGISDAAQKLLKDIVFIELPSEGESFSKGDKVCEIESVKALDELNAPLSGEVVDVNTELDNSVQAIKDDPYGEGWFIKLKAEKPAEFDELLSADDYKKFVESLDI